MQLFDEFADTLLRITEHHGHLLLIFIEWVGDIGVTRFEVVVADDDLLCLVYIKHRHTINWGTLCFTSCRIDYIISSHYDYEVGVAEVIIDLLHLKELLVVYIGLCK